MAKRKDSKDFDVRVLSYKRINNCSDGLFYQANSTSEFDKIQKLEVKQVGIRGPMDTRPKNPTKPDKNPLSPNPQVVDVCRMDNSMDTLIVKYNLQFADIPVPHNCDNAYVRKALNEMHKCFAREGIYDVVALRVAQNIANARALWRNRMGCKEIKVSVELVNEKEPQKPWDFDAFTIPLYFTDEKKQNMKEEDKNKIKEIAAEIAEVYKGEVPYKNFRVSMTAVKFFGLEVFPSQEMLASRDNSKASNHTKFLYQVGRQAAFHPQKITNALLCIDDWHPESPGEPVSVNVYSTISQEGFIGRRPESKKDFYNLFDSSKDEICKKMQDGDEISISSINHEERCFVAAMLIRGGVFGKSGKDSSD